MVNFCIRSLITIQKKKDCGKSNKNDVKKIFFEVQTNLRIQIAKAADFAPFFNFFNRYEFWFFYGAINQRIFYTFLKTHAHGSPCF